MTDVANTTPDRLGPLDIGRVMAALPHRYPLLLVDRVEELVLDTSITAIKAVSMNEQFFQGHFPGRPIMPGVLIVEAMAQAAGILAVESLGVAGIVRRVAESERAGWLLPLVRPAMIQGWRADGSLSRSSCVSSRIARSSS